MKSARQGQGGPAHVKLRGLRNVLICEDFRMVQLFRNSGPECIYLLSETLIVSLLYSLFSSIDKSSSLLPLPYTNSDTPA